MYRHRPSKEHSRVALRQTFLSEKCILDTRTAKIYQQPEIDLHEKQQQQQEERGARGQMQVGPQ